LSGLADDLRRDEHWCGRTTVCVVLGMLCPGQRLERRWDMSKRGGNKTKSAPKPPMGNRRPEEK